ncbi:MAG: YHS domain-containing (seleno)protein [Bacteroidota bacterium]
MKRMIVVTSLALFCSIAMFAQKSPVFVADGAAIHGYDAVAYFTDSKPVKGDSLLSYSWNGVNWRFATEQNKEAFKANPDKYAPQYGGYCAYGASDGEGHKAPSDPEAWKVVEGKLYFNYNKSVQQMWFKRQDELIKTADKNWPSLKDKGK